MFPGLGNFFIAPMIRSAGFIPSFVILNPANSTSSLANWNLSLLKTTHLLLQRFRYSKVCQNAFSVSPSHRQVSSTHFVFRLTSSVMSSNRRVYPSPVAWKPCGPVK